MSATAQIDTLCRRCDGDGATSDFAECTTAGHDCACNGPSVSIDPCPRCDGSGERKPGDVGSCHWCSWPGMCECPAMRAHHYWLAKETP